MKYTLATSLVLISLLFITDCSNDKRELIPWQEAASWESLSGHPQEEKIRLGRKILEETSHYIGPKASDPKKRYAGNNLSCRNCHLPGKSGIVGTKPFSAPYLSVEARYPNFRYRSGKMGSVADRINGCMQRSLNGKALPESSNEMQAMLAFFKWIGQKIPRGENMQGQRLMKISLLDRAADYKKGKLIFDKQCVSCHQGDGQGLKNPNTGDYIYPPLWGEDSFNDGAGMSRVIKAARFIRGNMPLGASYENPILSEEEAFDVAAYINSRPRPVKVNREKDFPAENIKHAPKDYTIRLKERKRSYNQVKYGPWK